MSASDAAKPFNPVPLENLFDGLPYDTRVELTRIKTGNWRCRIAAGETSVSFGGYTAREASERAVKAFQGG
jgi:uncharacterized protein YegP (UPF0339 family)